MPWRFVSIVGFTSLLFSACSNATFNDEAADAAPSDAASSDAAANDAASNDAASSDAAIVDAGGPDSPVTELDGGGSEAGLCNTAVDCPAIVCTTNATCSGGMCTYNQSTTGSVCLGGFCEGAGKCVPDGG